MYDCMIYCSHDSFLATTYGALSDTYNNNNNLFCSKIAIFLPDKILVHSDVECICRHVFFLQISVHSSIQVGATHHVVVCACSVQIFIGYIIKQFEFIEQGQMR